MKPAPFAYRKVRTVAEAAQLLRESGGEAKIIAGGQSLGAMMNLRAASPGMLVDINGVDELKLVSLENGHLRIGAMVRHADVMEHPDVKNLVPILAYAYKFVAHAAIRNRGTLGGNVSHADPASELPAVLQVLNARMRISDGAEERVVAAEDFFVGMFETALGETDILVSIEIPVAANGRKWGFCETSTRHGDFAYLAVAVTCNLDTGAATDVRMAYAGLAEHAMRCRQAEAILEGRVLTDEIVDVAGVTASRTLPIAGDHQVTEVYRRDLARSLTARALAMATA